jgi:hypothetical protein
VRARAGPWRNLSALTFIAESASPSYPACASPLRLTPAPHPWASPLRLTPPPPPKQDQDQEVKEAALGAVSTLVAVLGDQPQVEGQVRGGRGA